MRNLLRTNLAVFLVLISLIGRADAAWFTSSSTTQAQQAEKQNQKQIKSRLSQIQAVHGQVMAADSIASDAHKTAVNLRQTAEQLKQSQNHYQDSVNKTGSDSSPEAQEAAEQLAQATKAHQQALSQAKSTTGKAMLGQMGQDIKSNAAALLPVGAVKGSAEVVGGYAVYGTKGVGDATLGVVKAGAVTTGKVATAAILGKGIVAGAAIAGVTAGATAVVSGGVTGGMRGYKNTAEVRRELSSTVDDQQTKKEAQNREKDADTSINKKIDQHIEDTAIGQKGTTTKLLYAGKHHVTAPVKAVASGTKYVGSKIVQAGQSIYTSLKGKSAQVQPEGETPSVQQKKPTVFGKISAHLSGLSNQLKNTVTKYSSGSSYDKKIKGQAQVLDQLTKDKLDAAEALKNNPASPDAQKTYQLSELMELKGRVNIAQTRSDQANFNYQKATLQAKSANVVPDTEKVARQNALQSLQTQFSQKKAIYYQQNVNDLSLPSSISSEDLKAIQNALSD